MSHERDLADPAANAAIVRRLESLAADAPRQWGKMTPAQMCAHCQKPFEVAAGELKLRRGLIGKLFGRLAKKRFIDGPAPFGSRGSARRGRGAVRALRGVRFHRDTERLPDAEPGEHGGLLAQEVQAVLPELVREAPTARWPWPTPSSCPS